MVDSSQKDLMVENFVTAFLPKKKVVQGIKHILGHAEAPEALMKNQHLMNGVRDI